MSQDAGYLIKTPAFNLLEYNALGSLIKAEKVDYTVLAMFMIRSGARVLRIVENNGDFKTSLFEYCIDDFEEGQSVDISTVTGKIANVSNNESKIIIRDYQKSARLEFDETLLLRERSDYYPYGSPVLLEGEIKLEYTTNIMD